MLLNNFSRIKENTVSENKTEAVFTIDPSHEIFEGHFPGQPVVPGVTMVQMVKEILETTLDKKLQLTEASQIKFLKLLVPKEAQNIHANITWSEENGQLKTNATLTENGSAVFKMTGIFRAL